LPRGIKLAGEIIFLILIVLYAVHLIEHVWPHTASLQWDFTIYYYAAEAHSQDLDPYQLENLSELSGQDLWLPFVYPPSTLWFFGIFNHFSFSTAYHIWLLGKVLLLVILIFIWSKYFLDNRFPVLLILFVLLAYDSAVYWDIKSGNISMLEQFFIWTAFAFYIKKKPILFAALIILIAIFKFTPVFFLLLLLFSGSEKKWRNFACALGTFLTVIFISYLSQPELYKAYIDNALAIDERASDFNYGVLAFMQDIFSTVGGGELSSLRGIIPFSAYLITALAICLVSMRSLNWRLSDSRFWDNRLTVLLSCAIYVLILPRFKCYSFIILIPPSYYIMKHYVSTKAFPFILLLLLIPVSTPLPEGRVIDMFFRYYPLYMSFIIWLLFISYIRRKTTGLALP
jgi:hypothetical protein